MPDWFAGSAAGVLGVIVLMIGFINDINDLVFEEPPNAESIFGVVKNVGRDVAVYVCSFAPQYPRLIGGLCAAATPPKPSNPLAVVSEGSDGATVSAEERRLSASQPEDDGDRPSPEPPREGVPDNRSERIPVRIGKGASSDILSMVPGLGRIESFKDCPNCPAMVVIPAGSFVTGRGRGRRVTISEPFAISKQEVTVAQWRACVSAGDCKNRRQPDAPNTPGDLPVVNVSYLDARDYAIWLSTSTDQPYKLPTAIQWEYAARSTSTGQYWWRRDEINALYANYRGSEGKGSIGPLKPVDAYPPNFWGLYNVHGNAAEWVHDCAPRNCRRRVLRGGSRKDYADAVTATARIYKDQTAADENTGFRVVREIVSSR